MRKLFLFTLSLCLVAGISSATLVTGYVYDAATAIPIPSQKVYVRDSFSTYRDSTITASDGSYSISLPSALPFNRLFTYTNSCGTIMEQAVTYTGSPWVVTFVVCSTTPLLYSLQGNVTLGGAPNSGPVKIYLIRKQYDPVLSDTTLRAIDSISTTTGSYFRNYTTYPGAPGVTLLLKAALQPGHSNYSSYLPSYHDSSLIWSGATALGPANFISAKTHVNLMAGVNPGGPGFIGGSVLVGANKQTAVGDPLPHRILILTNSAGKPVAYTYSDAAGKFRFPNLAMGTYRISGDVWGKANPPLTVTLTAANPNVNNVTFEENNRKFWGHVEGLSIAPSRALTGVYPYPNPVTDLLRIAGLEGIKGGKSVVISSVTGAVVSRHQTAPQGAAEIFMASLPAGLYTLQVQTESGVAVFTVLK